MVLPRRSTKKRVLSTTETLRVVIVVALVAFFGTLFYAERRLSSHPAVFRGDDSHSQNVLLQPSNSTQQRIPSKDDPIPSSNELAQLYADYRDLSASLYQWDTSNNLPLWLKSYFRWMVQQRQALTPENWKSHKYLILRCLESDEHCGGASDRLNQIPYLLKLGAWTRRLFFIRWTRPCALEEFFVPPSNGYNWTMPEWLVTESSKKNVASRYVVRPSGLKQAVVDPQLTLVTTRMQRTVGWWQGTYNGESSTNDNDDYGRLFHDMFVSLFQPSPPLAAMVQHELDQMGLVPGEYAAAHYRAFYGTKLPDADEIAKRTVGAINCASQLRPGGPIYFASDSELARTLAHEYSRNHSVAVVHSAGSKPLHLDRTEDWDDPMDFFPTFVDLLLMGQSRCLVYGNGGFGKFAHLISYGGPDCVARLKRPSCAWAETPSDAVEKARILNE